MTFQLRRATIADAKAIAAVFSPSVRLLTFLPELHTVDEDRQFVENVMLRQCEVTVAEGSAGIIAFVARDREELRLLHTHPDHVGCGAGTALVEFLKAGGVAALELWCFEENMRARQFYEARGFKAIKFTDGAHNEAKVPDVRYRWERPETDRS